ncbi:MAG: FAD binding domain-containing protein [Acholeplasmataceae bacterium]|nr:FAD binding domain-containing protein [Acholeplasmataceae bacterium]
MVKHLIPKNYQEALKKASQTPYIKIAGGTDLMVQKRGSAQTEPKFDKPVMYLFNLPELNHITAEYDILKIGSMTPFEVILKSEDTPLVFKQVLVELASPGIRNIATLAGNIGNASPAGDALVYLYAIRAKVVLESLRGTRILPIHEVILGPRQTSIESDEIIKEIHIPLKPFTHTRWVKVGGRKADAISKVSFIGLALIENNIIKDIRIALGAVYKTVANDQAFERSMTHMSTVEINEKINTVKSHYQTLIKPIDDQRSNQEYRKKVSMNLIEDFIKSLKEEM